MPYESVISEGVSDLRALNPKVISSHPVSLIVEKSTGQRWIKKECENKKIAERELVAQEFFRFIYPHQPRTRLIYSHEKKYYILSEYISLFMALPTQQKDGFLRGKYKGLGTVCLLAVFLQEIDFKNGNVGVDGQNNIIKIDGDWCFASFDKKFSKKNYAIEGEAIEQLPIPTGFYAYNWLDLIKEEQKSIKSKFIYSDQQALSPLFRSEVNKAILRVILLSNDQINLFIGSLVRSSNNTKKMFIEFLIIRRNKLLWAALNSKSFMSFVNSEDAKRDLNHFRDEHNLDKEDLEQRLEKLKGLSAQADVIISYVGKIKVGLSKLRTLRIGSDDKVVLDYIKDVTAKVSVSFCDVDALVLLLKDVREKVKALDGEEVRAIKDKITMFRHRCCFFNSYFGGEKKARAIEKALQDLPIEKRSHVISSEGPANEVQLALAKGRFGSKFFVSLDENKKLIYKKSARSYQQLQDAFVKPSAWAT